MVHFSRGMNMFCKGKHKQLTVSVVFGAVPIGWKNILKYPNTIPKAFSVALELITSIDSIPSPTITLSGPGKAGLDIFSLSQPYDPTSILHPQLLA